MAVLIIAGKTYYRIPDDVLKACKITKKQFEKACREAAGEVSGQSIDRKGTPVEGLVPLVTYTHGCGRKEGC